MRKEAEGSRGKGATNPPSGIRLPNGQHQPHQSSPPTNPQEEEIAMGKKRGTTKYRVVKSRKTVHVGITDNPERRENGVVLLRWTVRGQS